jgi:CRP/FNR family transcriptional regulator, dissimilatory nitrate respiration regulator
VHDSEQAGQGHREAWLPQSVRDAGVNRVLDTGDFLFRIDTPTAGLFEVIKGRIKLVRIAESGRETILYTASAGAFVAEASLFSPTYHCDAVATVASVVRLYPKRSLFAAFREDPKAAQAFMAMLAHEIMNLRTRLDLRNIRTARDRVRHHLVLHAEADGRTVVLSGTLKDLAGELGLTHEALYRTLADMVADDEIERLDGKIRLKSPGV